jgi:hypothetical protein
MSIAIFSSANAIANAITSANAIFIAITSVSVGVICNVFPF